MIGLLLLASISRCVSADLCPTDAEIMAAVIERDEQSISAALRRLEEEQPGSINIAHAEPIRVVEDVLCGDALSGDLPTMTCRFTVRYPSKDTYQVARFVKRDAGWKIDEALMVTRN